MDTSDLIVKCLNLYDTIKPKNSRHSYTVLAALFNRKTSKLFALATGTQACLQTYPDDIEDCHAESLLKRAYKRYLIDRLISAENEFCFDQVRDELSRECDQGLTLLISQFPCGLVRRYEGQEPIDKVTGLTIKRKPGRGTVIDGKTVYVEKDSCLEKLKRWVSSGLMGEKLQNVLHARNNLIQTIIIGNCEPDESLDYPHYVKLMSERLGSPIVDITLASSVRRDEFVYDSDKQPQPVAVVWWDDWRRSTGNLEYIVDGHKRGLTKKQCSSNDLVYKLKVSNACLRKDLDKIHG